MIQGNNLILKMNGQPIGGCKTCSVDAQSSMLAAASNSSVNDENVPEQKAWKIQTTQLVVATLTAILGMTAQRMEASFELRRDSGNIVICSGYVICNHVEVTATVNSLATGSFEFTGDGKMTTILTQGDYNNDFNGDFFI